MNQILLQPRNPISCSAAPSHDVFPSWRERIRKQFRPPTFPRLEQSLSALATEFTLTDCARLRILVSGRPRPLDDFIQQQIYLIAREALLNALRHSGATSVEAELEYLPHKFRLMIRDNGSGINPQALLRDSPWGLLEMRERASNIGARLRVWSREGAGTEIEISVPEHIAEAFRSGQPV